MYIGAVGANDRAYFMPHINSRVPNRSKQGTYLMAGRFVKIYEYVLIYCAFKRSNTSLHKQICHLIRFSYDLVYCKKLPRLIPTV